MARKASRWIPLFKEFIKDLRISSKEVASEDLRGVKLKLWDSQKRFLEEVGHGLDDDVRIFKCLKSRQLGCTTISLAIDVFWLALHPKIRGALVTDSEKNRDSNRATIREYIRSFPQGYFGEDFTIAKGGDNRMFMAFSNGSRLDFLVAGVKKKSTAWGEGVGYALAHLTELASYGDAEGLASFEESFAQKNPQRLFLYESTAKGFNHWRSTWRNGIDNPAERSFFIGWWASDINRIEKNDPRFEGYSYPPTREERELMVQVARLYTHRITEEQLAWIRWREANATADAGLLEQNQPWTAEQAFVVTGTSFFQTRAIARDLKFMDENLDLFNFYAYNYEYGNEFFDLKVEMALTQEDADRCELRIWEEPVEGGHYVIGCDPAYGRNEHKDRHAIEVFRCFADKMVQVAEFATADVEVKHCAWVLAHLAGAYNDCVVNVELSGPGRMIIQEWEHLRGILNAEMYQQKVQERKWDEALYQARWYLYTRPDTMGRGFALNFETNWRTKQEIMHQLRGSYATRELDLKSRPLYNEMTIVVQDGHEIGAPESRAEDTKDDRVFAMALANRAWLNWRRPQLIAEGKTYEVVMKEERGETTRAERSVNNLVFRFLKTQQELAEMPKDDRPPWMVQRGLA